MNPRERQGSGGMTDYEGVDMDTIDEREARYARAIRAEVAGPEAFGDYVDRAARAVMAVADAEQDALRADWDRQLAWWQGEARRHHDALGSLRQRIEAMAYEALADEQEPWVTPFELREALSDLGVKA